MVDWKFVTALGWGIPVLLVTASLAAACGGKQRVRHYQPEVDEEAMQGRSTREAPDLTLAVENFSTGTAYDEQRMVYRSGPYRFDYYHFHRWPASPGMVVGDFLRDVFRRSKAFESVIGAYATRADVVLSGRVLAIEEVDVNDDDWQAHVSLDLRLRDAATGELLWTETKTKRKPLSEQSPEGLTKAVSEALTEIGLETIDEITKAAKDAIRQRRRDAKSKTFRKEKSNKSESGESSSEESGESKGFDSKASE